MMQEQDVDMPRRTVSKWCKKMSRLYRKSQCRFDGEVNGNKLRKSSRGVVNRCRDDRETSRKDEIAEMEKLENEVESKS
jgi:hypothetical protein